MIKKRFISILALLCLMVSGASADPQEELLTTVTATGLTTYTQTVEGIVTVTPNASDYYASGGWYYMGSVTVEPVSDEYTITRCVFIEPYESLEDDLAPFIVSMYDNTVSVETKNGVASKDMSIKTIEVYGYKNSAASTYTVTLKEGTEDATSWTIAPAEATTAGVAAGTTVTATYSGTKKVKSVKAVKKAPAGPTTVTWNSSNVSDLNFWGGAPDGYDTYTKEGITLRGNAEQCDASWQNWGGGQEGIMFAMNAPGGYTFTAPDGKKFTKIEITATTYEGWYTYAYFGQLESGWPAGEAAANDFNSTLKFTWTGSAASVNLATTLNSFGPSLASSIVFTLE